MATKYLCPNCKRKHNNRSSAASCCSSGGSYNPTDVYIESIYVPDTYSGSSSDSCGSSWGDSSSSSCDSGGGGGD